MLKYLISLVVFFLFTYTGEAQEAVKKGTIILGSYHAYYMDWENVKSFKRNSSVPDFTSQQLAWTLKHNVIEENPKYCILQTGPEDLMLGISPARVIENISKIHNELMQDSIRLVILSGIQNPVKKSIGSVIKLNTEIESWALDNEIIFINISDLVASSGAFDEEFKILSEYQQKIIKRINARLNDPQPQYPL